MSKQLSINPEKCLGCRTCELYCSVGHNEEFNPRVANVSVMAYENAAICIPIMCMQCDKASCLEVCPVGAITRNQEGTVVMNPDKCIGCKMCMNACPLGNIGYDPAKGLMHKCDLCGGDPMCAKHCPTGAITFTDPTESPSRKAAVAEQFKEVFGEEVES